MKFSLRYTIPIILLIFTIVLGVLSLKINGRIALERFQNDLSTKLITALTLLQGEVEYGFQTNNLERLQEEISDFGSGTHIKNLFLMDHDGKILSGIKFAQIGLNVKDALSDADRIDLNKKIETFKSKFSGIVFTSPDKNTLWGVYPVKIGFDESNIRPTKTGALVAEIDLVIPKQMVLSLVENQIIQFFSFLSLLMVVLGVFIHFQVTRRIQKLILAIESFSSGNHPPKIQVGGNDEITVLSKAFADMAEKRIQSKTKLQESEKNYRKLFGQLRSIVEETSSKDSKEFFRLLTQHLANSLNMRYAFIGELETENPDKIKTLAVWAGEDNIENFGYSLADTPCEKVLTKSLCCYPQNIQKLFPKDILLKEMNVEGYLGIPLFDSHHKSKGILAVMHDGPIVDVENAKIILSIFARQAESELERKNTVNALKESRNMLQLVIDTIPIGIFWKDRNSRYLGCNQHTAKTAGLGSPEEIIGKDDYSLIWNKYADSYRKDDYEIITTGKPKLHYEEPLHLQNEKELWVQTSKVPLKNIEGDITGVIATYEDITSRKEAEKELQRYQNHLEELVDERTLEIQLAKNALEASQKTYSNLLSNLKGMVYRCKNDRQWTTEFVSKGAYELTGYESEEYGPDKIINFNEIIHPDDRERIWDEVQIAINKKAPFVLTYRIITSQKIEKWVWEQGRGIYSDKGELEAIEGYITDITKQVEAEQNIKDSQSKLIHVEKLTALGKLTGSIAHEFNNPLQGIKSIMEIFENSGMSKEKLKLATLGRKECDRMANMIRGLQNFYKPTSSTITLESINKCLEDVIALQIKSLQEKNIQVIQHFSRQLPKVEAVEDQIKQVLLNLIQNAADAINANEGEITISTAKHGIYVLIKIQDTGMGVSEDDIESIFEPFYTTKGVKGTGLGLSISYGIIKDHGGNIMVTSELGRGSVFTITLPIQKLKNI